MPCDLRSHKAVVVEQTNVLNVHSLEKGEFPESRSRNHRRPCGTCTVLDLGFDGSTGVNQSTARGMNRSRFDFDFVPT